jgi:hypothetical protein
MNQMLDHVAEAALLVGFILGLLVGLGAGIAVGILAF